MAYCVLKNIQYYTNSGIISDLVNPNSQLYEQQIAAFTFSLNSISYAIRISPYKA